MKQFSKKFLTLTMLSGLALTSGQTLANASNKLNTISVSATGTASARPDIAILELGVESNAATAQEALNQNRESMLKIFQALKANGIKEEDIQTYDLSIYPSFNDKNKAKSYQASNKLQVKIRQIGQVGKIFDETISLGANASRGITFDNIDKTPYQDKARSQAVEKAIAKAKILAQAAQLKVGPILSINEIEEDQPIMPRVLMATTAANQNTPIAGGELHYSVNVRVNFAISQ